MTAEPAYRKIGTAGYFQFNGHLYAFPGPYNTSRKHKSTVDVTPHPTLYENNFSILVKSWSGKETYTLTPILKSEKRQITGKRKIQWFDYRLASGDRWTLKLRVTFTAGSIFDMVMAIYRKKIEIKDSHPDFITYTFLSMFLDEVDTILKDQTLPITIDELWNLLRPPFLSDFIQITSFKFRNVHTDSKGIGKIFAKIKQGEVKP